MAEPEGFETPKKKVVELEDGSIYFPTINRVLYPGNLRKGVDQIVAVLPDGRVAIRSSKAFKNGKKFVLVDPATHFAFRKGTVDDARVAARSSTPALKHNTATKEELINDIPNALEYGTLAAFPEGRSLETGFAAALKRSMPRILTALGVGAGSQMLANKETGKEFSPFDVVAPVAFDLATRGGVKATGAAARAITGKAAAPELSAEIMRPETQALVSSMDRISPEKPIYTRNELSPLERQAAAQTAGTGPGRRAATETQRIQQDAIRDYRAKTLEGAQGGIEARGAGPVSRIEAGEAIQAPVEDLKAEIAKLKKESQDIAKRNVRGEAETEKSNRDQKAKLEKLNETVRARIDKLNAEAKTKTSAENKKELERILADNRKRINEMQVFGGGEMPPDHRLVKQAVREGLVKQEKFRPKNPPPEIPFVPKEFVPREFVPEEMDPEKEARLADMSKIREQLPNLMKVDRLTAPEDVANLIQPTNESEVMELARFAKEAPGMFPDSPEFEEKVSRMQDGVELAHAQYVLGTPGGAEEIQAGVGGRLGLNAKAMNQISLGKVPEEMPQYLRDIYGDDPESESFKRLQALVDIAQSERLSPTKPWEGYSSKASISRAFKYGIESTMAKVGLAKSLLSPVGRDFVSKMMEYQKNPPQTWSDRIARSSDVIMAYEKMKSGDKRDVAQKPPEAAPAAVAP